MKILFHSTTPVIAQNFVCNTGQILPIGKGEFGKGFYTAREQSLAAMWGMKMHKGKFRIVEFEISDSEYNSLSLMNLDHKASDNFRRMVIKSGEGQNNYVSKEDVVIGTVQNRAWAIQEKFQSQSAIDILNESRKNLK